MPRRVQLLRPDDEVLRRYEMVRARLVEGRKVLDICRAFGTTLPTLYTWIHRFQEGGMLALADRPRGPRHPNRTPGTVEEAIVARRREDSWRSASAIAALLGERGVEVHPRTVQRILKRRDLPRIRAGEKTPGRPRSRTSPRPPGKAAGGRRRGRRRASATSSRS